MSKLNFGGLKQKSEEMINDPDVQEFIGQAETEETVQKTAQKKKRSQNPFGKRTFESPKVLSVSGKMTHRNNTCGPQRGLFLKRELEEWIEKNCLADQGGTQIVLNYLIARGICATIEQVEKQGAIHLNFEEKWPDIKDYIADFSADEVA